LVNLKKKLVHKELTIGSWLSIGSPAVAEIMAKAGFEWIVIDMEHSAISVSQCQEIIRIVDLCRVAPLGRVGANDPLLIKRAMDAGAHGVIVPMVNSQHDAEKAVSAVKYPLWRIEVKRFLKLIGEGFLMKALFMLFLFHFPITTTCLDLRSIINRTMSFSN